MHEQPADLPTAAAIFERAKVVAESYATSYGDRPARAWDQWHLIARDDFWDSAALDLRVPEGHPLRMMPDEYATPMRDLEAPRA